MFHKKWFFCAISAVSLVANAQERPNILWLTSEDNSASWLGCYGNEFANTPNLDQMAADGFQYMHAYANAPVCAASRSTWITGIYSLSMGTHPMRSFYEIPHDKIKLYPDALKANGYYVGNFKKMDYNFGGRSGSTIWDSIKPVDWNMLKSKGPFFQVINIGSTHESQAFGDIENTKHNPANVKLAAYHPDVPDMRKNYAKYYDAVEKTDKVVGDALKSLETAGLADDTIVVYCSDHGGVLPRSKRFLFQNSLHCPLIIRIPDKYKHLYPAEKTGSKIDRLVSFVDMPKTWLSITNSEIPETMQGKIFLGTETEPEREYHFAFRGRMDDRIDNARALIDKRFLYIRNYMPYVAWMQELTYLWQMPASKAWMRAIDDGTATEAQARFFAPKNWTEELYDMQSDPDNVNNLVDSPEHRVIIQKMRKRLRNEQETMFDSGLIPETERVRLAEKNNTTIYEMIRNPKLWNMSELIDAADLALAKDANKLPALRKMLDHPHIGMRYWGTIGGFLLNDQQIGEVAISDESDEIRAMAAWLLVRAGEKERGLNCLTELINERSYSLLTVLNIADWMGDDAQALVPAMQNLTFKESWPKQYKYEIRMRDVALSHFNAKIIGKDIVK